MGYMVIVSKLTWQFFRYICLYIYIYIFIFVILPDFLLETVNFHAHVNYLELYSWYLEITPPKKKPTPFRSADPSNLI